MPVPVHLPLPLPLRNGHLQTVVSSLGRRLVVPGRARSITRAAHERVLEVVGGTRLSAWINQQDQPAPLVVIIHGWLGGHSSSYVLSAASALWSAGFSVVRLNLPDHGESTHLNEALFHSAMIDEAVDAVVQLAHGATGVMGFSLGGNFALRIAGVLGHPTLAVCPLMDPAATMAEIDRSALYRRYFVSKWRRALKDKERAFPDRYAFAESGDYVPSTVTAITRQFVARYSPFESVDDYYSRYTLNGSTLAGVEATILAARDDPIVPADDFGQLPPGLSVWLTSGGGHCAFVNSYALTSYADEFACRYFLEQLGN